MESRDERVTNNPKPLQQTATMETLPEEILVQIFSKLPFSSLIRFKCVCKAWKELSQHQFVSHLYNNNNQCLMLYSNHSPSRDRLRFVEFNSNSYGEDTSLKEIRIPFGSSSSSSLKLNVLGSYNSLLCLSSPDHNDQYIYNPFTSQYIELPKTSHSRVQWAVFGLGFHPKTKEFKVVKFIYYRASERLERRNYEYYMGNSKVQVFTLGSTRWRDLGPARHILKDSVGKNVIVNQRLHYLSDLNKDRHDSDIISFDLEDEQFRVINKPYIVYIRWSDSLLVLKGCLSVASYASNGQGLEIWIQKEYDDEDSWVKWLNIAIQSHVPKGLRSEVGHSYYRRWSNDHRVLCELKNGEILLEYESRALVVYDSSNGSFKDVELQGMPRLFHSVLHLGNLNQIDAIVGSNF